MQILKQWSVWLLLAIGMVGMACDGGGVSVEAGLECAEKEDGTACNDGEGVCQNGMCQLNVSVEACGGQPDGTACDSGNGTCQDGTCQPNTPQPGECESATNGTPCATGVCHDSTCKAPEDVPCGTGAGTLCAQGFTCDNTQTCVPVTQPGECESAADDGTPCDNGNGVCHDSTCKAPEDVPCGTGAGTLCAGAGETCQGGTCQTVTQPDECESATDGDPCDNGNGVCQNEVCVALPYAWTVTFDSNGADTPADPEEATVAEPATNVGALPTEPTRVGYEFIGWNTEEDGSGTPFDETTDVDADLTVYAQWRQLVLDWNVVDAAPLSPLNPSLVFSVVVSGFVNAADANNAMLAIDRMDTGLQAQVESATVQGTSTTFRVRVEYDGVSEWASGSGAVQFALGNAPGYTLSGGAPSATLSIRDGQEKTPARVIWVGSDNILDFNTYANTAAGLAAHYLLTEDVVLPAPPAADQSNWNAIGNDASPFTGSFDGDGHTLSGLVIHSTESYQAMFGYINSGAEVENLGLLDVSVTGAGYVGGLAGGNGGTVQGCSAAGEVSGSGDRVGGLLGYNAIAAEVHNSHAAVSTTGSDTVGGLVGFNRGSVHNSYATGNVTGTDSRVGGLVGWSFGAGTVANSYATGDVRGSSSVGGLMGSNGAGCTLQHSMALNRQVSTVYNQTSSAGRVVGSTSNGAPLLNNYAFAGMYNREDSTAWGATGETTIHGADITAQELQAEAGFLDADLVFTSSPWTYEDGSLPGLLGQTVEMPDWLQFP